MEKLINPQNLFFGAAIFGVYGAGWAVNFLLISFALTEPPHGSDGGGMFMWSLSALLTLVLVAMGAAVVWQGAEWIKNERE